MHTHSLLVLLTSNTLTISLFSRSLPLSCRYRPFNTRLPPILLFHGRTSVECTTKATDLQIEWHYLCLASFCW